MRIFLWILAVLSLIEGFNIYQQAESAIHQILAYMSFLIFAVFLSGAAIVEAIYRTSSERLGAPENEGMLVKSSPVNKSQSSIKAEQSNASQVPPYNCPFCSYKRTRFGKCPSCGNTVDKWVMEAQKPKE